MKKNNIFVLFSLVFLVVSCIFAQKTITLEELRNMNKKKVKKEKPKNIPEPEIAKPITGKVVSVKETETLAEGSQSKMTEPFIYIARTKTDFDNLKTLIEGFSTDKKIDFKKQAVIAAFAGTKNTGGYSVSITETEGQPNVAIKSPPKDAMVTQALTSPYKVSIVSVEEEDSLNVVISEEFQSKVKKYIIPSGRFEFAGGFLSMQSKFDIEGIIGVMKANDFITFIFNLKGKGNASQRKLIEFASAKIEGGSNSIQYNTKIARVEGGNFIDKPHPPFVVEVKFAAGNIFMKFNPGKRDYVVSDGYEGRGELDGSVAGAGFKQ